MSVCENENVYISCDEDKDQFQVLFKYASDEFNMTKPIEFHRSLSETIDIFVSRVSLKLTNLTNKKTKKKSKVATDAIARDVTVKLTQNDLPVNSSLTCGELFKNVSERPLYLQIMDKNYKLLINYPWIYHIALPKSMMVGFPVYPTKFNTAFTDKMESEYLWYRITASSSVTTDLVPISREFFYTPKLEDLGHYLKFVCTPKNGDKTGLPVEAISGSCVVPGPGDCPFENRHRFTKEKLTGHSFRVVSYNILADLYASSEDGKNKIFTYCAPYALGIDYRKSLLMKELLGYNADIICLQEVDCKIFANDLTIAFGADDVGGVFCKKGGNVSEGVACFYRKSRFRVLTSSRIILGEETEENDIASSDIFSSPSEYQNIMQFLKERTTVLQIVVLEPTDKSDSRVVLANTHLYFHPDADHIRLLQSAVALRYVNHVVQSLRKNANVKIKTSVIFCGDFNSTPDCGVYELFTKGVIDSDHKDWKMANSEALSDICLKQPFTMGSACGTPPFTNFTVNFSDCLDYIFYQKGSFEVEQVVPFLTYEEVAQFQAIPSVVVPSDHLALVADLKWKIE